MFDSRQSSPRASRVWVVRSEVPACAVSQATLDAAGPDWSSRNVIAFSENSMGSPSDIFTIRPDGSGLRQITHSPHGVENGPLAFSPDGRDIVFTRWGGNRIDVYVMTASGQGMRDLTARLEGSDVIPDWDGAPSR